MNEQKFNFWFGSPYDRDCSMDGLRDSLQQFSEYVSRLSRFLDVLFVFEQSLKYNIRTVSFRDPQAMHCHPSWEDDYAWRDGAMARISRLDAGPAGDGYVVYLNPKLDIGIAAAQLTERTGMRIQPDEVYYYAFFHECGHTRAAAGLLAAECLEARAFFFGRKYIDGTFITKETYAQARIAAEKRADEWAMAELKKWRKTRSRNAGTPSIGDGVAALLS